MQGIPVPERAGGDKGRGAVEGGRGGGASFLFVARQACARARIAHTLISDTFFF